MFTTQRAVTARLPRACLDVLRAARPGNSPAEAVTEGRALARAPHKPAAVSHPRHTGRRQPGLLPSATHDMNVPLLPHTRAETALPHHTPVFLAADKLASPL